MAALVSVSVHGLSLVVVSEVYSVAVCRLLIAVASLITEHGALGTRASVWLTGPRAQAQ